MNLVRRFLMQVLTLPLLAALWLWVGIWRWCYPEAGPAVAEALAAELAAAGAALEGGRRPSERRWGDRARTAAALLAFLARLPLLARAQAAAERSAATRTRGELAGAAPRSSTATTRLREAILLALLAGGLVAGGAVVASIAATGNFLFEVHATPDAPGEVTPYLQVAAAATSLALTFAGSGLVALAALRRLGRGREQ
jgi:hypothetical protein